MGKKVFLDDGYPEEGLYEYLSKKVSDKYRNPKDEHIGFEHQKYEKVKRTIGIPGIIGGYTMEPGGEEDQYSKENWNPYSVDVNFPERSLWDKFTDFGKPWRDERNVMENSSHQHINNRGPQLIPEELQDVYPNAQVKNYSDGAIPDTEVRTVGAEDARVNLYEAKLIDDYGSVGETMVKDIGSGDIGPDGQRRYRMAGPVSGVGGGSGDFSFNAAGIFREQARMAALKKKNREDELAEKKLEDRQRAEDITKVGTAAYKGLSAMDMHKKGKIESFTGKFDTGGDESINIFKKTEDEKLGGFSPFKGVKDRIEFADPDKDWTASEMNALKENNPKMWKMMQKKGFGGDKNTMSVGSTFGQGEGGVGVSGLTPGKPLILQPGETNASLNQRIASSQGNFEDGSTGIKMPKLRDSNLDKSTYELTDESPYAEIDSEIGAGLQIEGDFGDGDVTPFDREALKEVQASGRHTGMTAQMDAKYGEDLSRELKSYEFGEPGVRSVDPMTTNIQDPNTVISSLPGTGIDGIGSPSKYQPSYVRDPADMGLLESDKFYEHGNKIWQDGKLVDDPVNKTLKIGDNLNPMDDDWDPSGGIEKGMPDHVPYQSGGNNYIENVGLERDAALIQDIEVTESLAIDPELTENIPPMDPDTAGNLVDVMGQGLGKTIKGAAGNAIMNAGLELGGSALVDAGVDPDIVETGMDVYQGAKTVKSAYDSVKVASAVTTGAATTSSAFVPGLNIATGVLQMGTADNVPDAVAGAGTAIGGALMLTPLAPFGIAMVAGSSLWSLFS